MRSGVILGLRPGRTKSHQNESTRERNPDRTNSRQNENPVRTNAHQNEGWNNIVFRDINNNSWLLQPQNIIINTGSMLIAMIKAVCRLRCQCSYYTSVRLCWQLKSIPTCTGHRLNAPVGR